MICIVPAAHSSLFPFCSQKQYYGDSNCNTAQQYRAFPILVLNLIFHTELEVHTQVRQIPAVTQWYAR